MRALVVEDYDPLRRAVSEGLREAGFAVDATGDGEEGWWYAKSQPFDLIVLDLMLPNLNGLDLLRRLRQKGGETPVLVLTARDAVEDRVKGLDAGADDYLVKPFALEELIARARALVRRAYDHADPVIQVGDLAIDTAARRVTRAGAFVELTAREYALLQFLAMRAGQVVSRSEIWDHLYDFNAEQTSNVVDVHIAALRRKIRAGDKSNLIHTRRGQGYVLEDAG